MELHNKAILNTAHVKLQIKLPDPIEIEKSRNSKSIGRKRIEDRF